MRSSANSSILSFCVAACLVCRSFLERLCCNLHRPTYPQEIRSDWLFSPSHPKIYVSFLFVDLSVSYISSQSLSLYLTFYLVFVREKGSLTNIFRHSLRQRNEHCYQVTVSECQNSGHGTKGLTDCIQLFIRIKINSPGFCVVFLLLIVCGMGCLVERRNGIRHRVQGCG